MKVRFNKQITVDFVSENTTHEIVKEKTFYNNQVVEILSSDENVRGYLDLLLEEGLAIGIPKQGLTIL